MRLLAGWVPAVGAIILAGAFAVGMISIGFAAAGVFAFGVYAAGVFAFGGFAIGVFAFGPRAVGVFAFGPGAVSLARDLDALAGPQGDGGQRASPAGPRSANP